jgi:hypothetical protein
MSGSLYGKKKSNEHKAHPHPVGLGGKKNLIASYEKLYKTQHLTMVKLFNKSK